MPDAQPKAAPKPPPDLTGRTLGDFHILRKLGAGGMGQVYLARETRLKRDVALKLLRNDLNENLTALARFDAEAQAVAKLNHPNIVHIHQIGEADGLRYMVLEYVDGRNLRDYLARKGPPDLPVTLSVMRQVALALQKAHEEGIVHRDIKPENILVTRKVEVKVTDFGLSRFFGGDAAAPGLTQSGVTLGTPLYMSPEQVQGHPVDNRSDIYSFGVTCYHLLAGEPPFRGASAFDVALKHVQEQPRPLSDLRPDLPPDLCAMIHKMMAKNPDDRHQSARDVLRELMRLREASVAATGVLAATHAGAAGGALLAADAALSLSTLSGQTAAVPAPAAPARWWRWAAAGTVCLFATLGGVYVSARRPLPEPPAPSAAPPAAQGPGLPDVRPPEKLTTTRERELLAVLNAESTRPDDALKASVELGLLYLKERRLPEAAERFARLTRKSSEWRDPVTARSANIAGRLGQAVVLAHENKAEASHDLFLKVATESAPRPGAPKGADRPAATVSWLLLRFPDLNVAVADALDRDAANQNKAKLEPALEQLRGPHRPPKKE